MYLIGFPLLVIPFAIYNMIAFLTPELAWTAKVATIHLISGQDWTVTPEDILLAFSILLLAVEVMKSTRMGIRGDRSITCCRWSCSSSCWSSSCWSSRPERRRSSS